MSCRTTTRDEDAAAAARDAITFALFELKSNPLWWADAIAPAALQADRLSLFKSPFFANWKLHLIGSDAWRQGKTITNPFCISYRLFSQKSSFWLLQRDQSSLGNLKDSFFHCIFYGVVGYQFFARSWALTEEIESLARILMRMATKKVKKGENPPSPDSFYGQLHIYWEMEDPCARFSLELLLALEEMLLLLLLLSC